MSGGRRRLVDKGIVTEDIVQQNPHLKDISGTEDLNCGTGTEDLRTSWLIKKWSPCCSRKVWQPPCRLDVLLVERSTVGPYHYCLLNAVLWDRTIIAC